MSPSWQQILHSLTSLNDGPASTPKQHHPQASTHPMITQYPNATFQSAPDPCPPLTP